MLPFLQNLPKFFTFLFLDMHYLHDPYTYVCFCVPTHACGNPNNAHI